MSDYIHKEYPKTVGTMEFWKQIKRTVNGVEVSKKDIEQIVNQIQKALQLTRKDHLLDLGCGNGALASYLFNNIGKYTGIDFSTYLLQIASEFFKPNGLVSYIEGDIIDFMDNLKENNGYNKILIYGVISYFKHDDVLKLLRTIGKRLPEVQRIFIGNVPSKAKAETFYAARNVRSYDLNDPKSSIGVWWTEEEIIQAGRIAGFQANILKMPDSFYGAKYRFDLLLIRQ